MYDILVTTMLIVSVLLIIIVIVQPSKSNAASNLTGGAQALFGQNKKARGFEAVLGRMTVVLGTVFMVLALAIAYFSA